MRIGGDGKVSNALRERSRALMWPTAHKYGRDALENLLRPEDCLIEFGESTVELLVHSINADTCSVPRRHW
jgi:hypothetical protein